MRAERLPRADGRGVAASCLHVPPAERSQCAAGAGMTTAKRLYTVFSLAIRYQCYSLNMDRQPTSYSTLQTS